jgi:tetratricopeptide (TPR) repeat protein
MIFDELALLINALKNKGTGFYLVEAPDDATHDDLMDKIKNALESHEDKKTAVIYLLEKPPAQSIFSFVRDFVESFYDRQIFFIRNLEIAAGNTPENFLRELNFSRETLDSLNRNFIFMMNPDFAGLFMRYARDIFSWIPHRYRFEGKDIGFQKPVPPIYAEKKVEIENDKDRKYLLELIDLYEEQLQETSDDPKFSVKNIIKPLADLYKEYGDYDKELSCRQKIVAFYKEMGGAEYAESLVKLGLAYHNWSAGGQAGNTHPKEGIQKAIEAFKEALKVYTPERFPVEYVRTMNNLGAAYRDLPTGNAIENLQKAIEAFKEALKVYTLEKFPVEYAQTMNNLGVAYWESPADNIIDKNENLQNAISAYKHALKIYNAKDFAVEYAETQYNLELAYRELPVDSKMKKI